MKYQFCPTTCGFCEYLDGALFRQCQSCASIDGVKSNRIKKPVRNKLTFQFRKDFQTEIGYLNFIISNAHRLTDAILDRAAEIRREKSATCKAHWETHQEWGPYRFWTTKGDVMQAMREAKAQDRAEVRRRAQKPVDAAHPPGVE